jgi:hypothetical protein
VEPVFGIIKSVKRFRQLRMRGVWYVRSERTTGESGVESQAQGRNAPAIRRKWLKVS